LSFPGTVELPHFERTSFRVKKKIFATLAEEANTATLKFTEEDQAFFCSKYEKAFYPVKGKWGNQGWTFVNLETVNKNIINKALQIAYHNAIINTAQLKVHEAK